MRSLACAAIALTAFCGASAAHSELGDYLQHQIQVTAKPDMIDVAIEVTFDAAHSARERAAMDTDHDTRLSAEERRVYLDRIATVAEQAVRLYVDDVDTKLVPLYAPKLDLFDSGDMEAHPHLIRLTFFARATLATAKSVRVEDTLWPDHPSMMLASVAPESKPMLVASQQPGMQKDKKSTGDIRAVSFEVIKPAAPSAKARSRKSSTRRR